VLRCADCATDTEFEQPPCEDGHGADCPEWICCSCGAAMINAMGVTVTLEPLVPVRGAA
jgi:hypothetical protein